MDEIAAPVPMKPRRRRFAISLRAMMLLVLVVGGFLGWRARKASIQRRSVAAIKEVGGAVFYDYQVPSGKAGTFFARLPEHPVPAWLRRPIGDEYFQEAKEVLIDNRVRSVSPQQADATIDFVTKLDRVNFLQLIKVPISNAGFAKLAGMSGLEHMALLDVDVNDDGLSVLASFPALEHLSLRCRPGGITARGIEQIARQPRLKHLSLIHTSLPDPVSLAPMARMTNLEYLRLEKSPEDDACLEYLRGLTSMQVLDLRETKLTEAGVDRISGMKQLERLLVEGSKLTDAAMIKLEANHPKLTTFHVNPIPEFTDASLGIAAKLSAFKPIHLIGSNISDAGLDRIRGVKLDRLSVSGRGVTDAGIARLAGSIQFIELGLSETGVDGSDLSWLAGQAGLERLRLDRSKIGDSAMAAIASAPALKSLDVRGTKVTEAGVAEFRKARPDVSVESGPMEVQP